jgi:hypothetical protein
MDFPNEGSQTATRWSSVTAVHHGSHQIGPHQTARDSKSLTSHKDRLLALAVAIGLAVIVGLWLFGFLIARDLFG